MQEFRLEAPRLYLRPFREEDAEGEEGEDGEPRQNGCFGQGAQGRRSGPEG